MLSAGQPPGRAAVGSPASRPVRASRATGCVWPIEHICVLINCPSGPPPLPQHLASGPGALLLRDTQRSPQCWPGNWIWKEVGNSTCQSPQGSVWPFSWHTRTRLVPKHFPLCFPLSCGLLASPGLEGSPLPSSWHGCQAGSHGTAGLLVSQVVNLAKSPCPMSPLPHLFFFF